MLHRPRWNCTERGDNRKEMMLGTRAGDAETTPCFVASSGMLALALDDFTMLVVDTETRRVVRKFTGHRGNVNDMVCHEV